MMAVVYNGKVPKTPRFLVYSHADTPIMELDATRILSATRVEQINGEHSLTITTLQELEKEQRILVQDNTGKWREYVVTGEEGDHTIGDTANTYYCVWSLQHDLEGTKVSSMPGVKNPVLARVALEHALAGTDRWAVGLVMQTTRGGASMYYMSGWEALSKVVEVWGGEVTVTITVNSTSGVVSRAVNLLVKQGSNTAKRRFDYGRDISSIKRKVSDEPFVCRIIPRGKGEETDSGGYGRRITIESVNGGIEYLQDDEAVPLVRLPNGSGGWEYPTRIIVNDSIDDPQALKDWALEHITEYTRPKVTYTAYVLQFADAGMNYTGVALGDAVQCVDKTFCEGGLRIDGRVVKMTVDVLDPTNTELEIGYLGNTIADQFRNLQASVTNAQTTLTQMAETMATSEWIGNIITRINTEANATGGYTYITEGQGLRTYDKAVSDPLVGAEADAVVEIKGGTIRIANSRTSAGEWDWKTVFTSGHIAGELVTAANIVTGFIGSPSGNYWNLDTGEFRMATVVGGTNLVRGTDTFSKLGTTGWSNSGWGITATKRKWNQVAANTWAQVAEGTWMELAGSGVYNIDVSGTPNNAITSGLRLRYDLSAATVYQSAVPVAPSQSYVMSCYARSVNGGKLKMGWGTSTTLAAGRSVEYELDASWKRYEYSFKPTNASVYIIYQNSVAGDIEICGLQLESGTAATDWRPAREDTEGYADIQGADAKSYAEQQASQAISTADANAAALTDALNESLNQEGVFNRLTNYGAIQGLYMENGKLYINADYIKTGTIVANLIKAGIISDAAGKNSWNLTTGALTTTDMSATNMTATGSITSTKTSGGTTSKTELSGGVANHTYTTSSGSRACALDAGGLAFGVDGKTRWTISANKGISGSSGAVSGFVVDLHLDSGLVYSPFQFDQDQIFLTVGSSTEYGLNIDKSGKFIRLASPPFILTSSSTEASLTHTSGKISISGANGSYGTIGIDSGGPYFIKNGTKKYFS